MIAIEFADVAKSYGVTEAVSDFSLTIEEGAFCVLIGPSGCGKSTALRMINAMVRADRGRITLRGEDISGLDPVALRRHIGYVIQSVGLFPHWTIAENIAAVPRLLGWSKTQRGDRITDVARLVGIEPGLLDRYPDQLSGGQQQRVGVARALAADPPIILMDEPFAALDPASRGMLQTEVGRIHAQCGKTIVFVTHDMDEALRLATQLVVMDRGHVVQAGSPADILRDPATRFVRDFVGGTDLQLRLLDLVTVGARMSLAGTGAGPAIAESATLRQALDLMLAKGCTRLGVTDAQGGRLGEIHIADIVAGPDAD